MLGCSRNGGVTGTLFTTRWTSGCLQTAQLGLKLVLAASCVAAESFGWLSTRNKISTCPVGLANDQRLRPEIPGQDREAAYCQPIVVKTLLSLHVRCDKCSFPPDKTQASCATCQYHTKSPRCKLLDSLHTITTKPSIG